MFSPETSFFQGFSSSFTWRQPQNTFGGEIIADMDSTADCTAKKIPKAGKI